MKRKILLFFILFFMMGVACESEQMVYGNVRCVQAVSKRNRAIKAYRRYLASRPKLDIGKKKLTKERFRLCDINQDGVPEMLEYRIFAKENESLQIWNYRKGRMWIADIGWFRPMIYYRNKEGGICFGCRDPKNDSVLKCYSSFDGEDIIDRAFRFSDDTGEEINYFVDGYDEPSKKNFNKVRKKLIKSKKKPLVIETYHDLYLNTAKNRKKFLK